jgi:tetratricopeptide (TPR) repeat protein
VGLVALAMLLPGAALAQKQPLMAGTITSPDGTPVAGVTVRLEPKDSHGTRVEAKSNKKGRYLLGMVRTGAYKLHVVAEGDVVLLHMKGKAIDVDTGEVLWEADQDITGTPDLNVGSRHRVELDLVAGPESQTPQAKADAEAAAVSSDYDDALAKIKAEDWEGALGLLGPLSQKRPDFANTWYLMAFGRVQLKEWDEAIVNIDKALAIDPSFAGAHLLRGRALKGKGDLAGAEVEFRKEIEARGTEPLAVDAWVALGVMHEQAKRLPEAAQELERALEMDPSRREVALELSNIYAEMGDRQKAAATLERGGGGAGAGGEMDDTMLLNLAIGAINDKKYDEAAKLAQRLIDKGSTNPNLSMAHSVLARCDLNRGNMAGGKEHLQKALDLDPASKLAAENREILTSLKGVK